MLTPNRALLSGIPTLVGDALDATGTGQVRPFSVVKNREASVSFYTDGAFTALNGTIDISNDGGTTWLVFGSFDFVSSKVFSMTLTPGMLYVFNITNITQSTPPNIYAVMA